MDAMTDEALAEIEARLNAAEDEVTALCCGDHGWQMRIPVQPTDSEVVIGDALDDIRALLAEVRRLRNANGEQGE